MNLLFQIPITKSSVKSPAAFFTSFMKTEIIEKAYLNFLDGFPKIDQEFDSLQGKCVTILTNPDRFTVEYFYEVFDDEQAYQKSESVIIEYTFPSELEKIFVDQYQEFKKFCLEKFYSNNEEKPLSKNEKEYIKDLQRALKKINIELERSCPYADALPALLRPLYAITRFLYIHFGKYTLNPNSDEFIKKALASKSGTLNFLDEKISLNALLSISSIKNQDGTFMFKFDSSDQVIQKKLTDFYNQDLEKVTTPIQIFGDSMKVNYLIHKICLGTQQKLSVIQRLKIFKNNKSYILADLCYTDASRIDKMFGSPKDFIDSHFNSN